MAGQVSVTDPHLEIKYEHQGIDCVSYINGV